MPSGVPSMVRTERPASALAGTTQERMATPSTSTVQAPQDATPQPNLVPVRPSSSRSTHSRGMSGGASNSVSWSLTRSFMVSPAFLGAWGGLGGGGVAAKSHFVLLAPFPKPLSVLWGAARVGIGGGAGFLSLVAAPGIRRLDDLPGLALPAAQGRPERMQYRASW